MVCFRNPGISQYEIILRLTVSVIIFVVILVSNLSHYLLQKCPSFFDIFAFSFL